MTARQAAAQVEAYYFAGMPFGEALVWVLKLGPAPFGRRAGALFKTDETQQSVNRGADPSSPLTQTADNRGQSPASVTDSSGTYRPRVEQSGVQVAGPTLACQTPRIIERHHSTMARSRPTHFETREGA